MKIESSYAVEIKHINKLFKKTVSIYNDAVSFLCKKLVNDWDYLKEFTGQYRKAKAENFVHNTKDNKAKYDFDDRFPKMPSYLRRAAIATSLGHISSYKSAIENWEENGCLGKRPIFQYTLNQLPTFYRGNTYKDQEEDSCKLKLFVNNDWNWVKVDLKKTDMQYINKNCSSKKMSAPTLEKKHKKYFLRFAFEEEKELKETELENRLILAVDLGINTDATCSIMDSRGTVLKRKFINFKSEKDLINHSLNKIKGIQQKYGVHNHNARKLWNYVSRHNEELSRKIAKEISDYAAENQVDVIVFEYLDMKGKKKGSKKQRLHLWRKNTIQNIVTTKAHMLGIRISRICAWGTSKLAFDDSGEVVRGKKAGFDTYELCRFNSGKIYNCDLSASYNIGARYFIRELEKSTLVSEWCEYLAKVPDAGKRTTNTLSTLKQLSVLMA